MTAVQSVMFRLRRRGTQGSAGRHAGSVSSQSFGQQSEQLAERYLQRRGYTIMHRNYRVTQGEIDLVAQDGDTVVFVEVKARRNSSFGSPVLAVDARKQQRLTKAARHYLHRFHLGNRSCRFDVVSITQDASHDPNIELIQNAFELGES